MKKNGPVKKLVLSRETLTALDPSLSALAAGGSATTHTCTSHDSAISVCRPTDTNPLCA